MIAERRWHSMIFPDQTSPHDVGPWLAEVNADVLIVDHTHIPLALAGSGGRLVVNSGALLRDSASGRVAPALILDLSTGDFVPGPAPGGGTFGVLELPEMRFTVHQASYGAEVEIARVMLGGVDRRRCGG